MISRTWQKMARFRGLLVLVLWQAVPIGTDRNGNTRIGFGVGGGVLEYATLDCNGDVTKSDTAPFRHVSGEVERHIGSAVAHVSAGYQWADSLSARGPFGTFNVGYDGKNFGIKGGLAAIPGNWDIFENGPRERNTIVLPSVSVRIGNRARTHVAARFLPPGAQTPSQMMDFIVEYNGYDATKASGSVGVGLIGDADNYQTSGVVGSYFRPVGHNVEVGARGFYSPGMSKAQTGLTAQVRMTMR